MNTMRLGESEAWWEARDTAIHRKAQVQVLEEFLQYMTDYGDEFQGQSQAVDWADRRIGEIRGATP